MATVEVLKNEDGSIKIHPVTKEPMLHYTLEDGENVFQTSPLVEETITTADGTVYDLAPRIVIHKAEHLDELIARHDGLHHAAFNAQLAEDKRKQDEVDAALAASLEAAAPE